MKPLFTFKKLKTRLICLLMPLIAFSSLLTAQKNFADGGIILSNGDKVQGKINYFEWEANPILIQFKKENGGLIEYGAESLKGFFLANGELYESYQLLVETESNKASKIDLERKEEKKEISVFLKVELKGVYNLLSLRDKDDDVHFFIQQDKDQPIELIYKRQYVYAPRVKNHPYTPKEGKAVNVDERYKGQLNYYFQNCPDFYKQIIRTRYALNSLKSLFRKYFTCIGNEPVLYESKKETAKPKFCILGGISLTQINIEGSQASVWYRNFEPDPSIQSSFGIGLNLVFPRNRGRWSFYSEFLFKSQKFSDIHRENPLADIIDQYQSEISMNYLRWNNMFRGKISVNKIAPFFQVGFSNGLMISRDDSVLVERFKGSEKIDENTVPFLTRFKDHEFGVIGGLGVTFNDHLGLEIRYEHSTGFENFIVTTININSFYFLISYQF